MVVRHGRLARLGGGLLLLAGMAALSVAGKPDLLPLPWRIAMAVLGIAVLWPVRSRLAPEAWLTDGPRSRSRHALSAGLMLPWFVLMIGVGELLRDAFGDVAAAATILPGIAIGFIGSYALGDRIADYLMSPQFTGPAQVSEAAAERPGAVGTEGPARSA
jgi:hypothetical protein